MPYLGVTEINCISSKDIPIYLHRKKLTITNGHHNIMVPYDCVYYEPLPYCITAGHNINFCDNLPSRASEIHLSLALLHLSLAPEKVYVL